MPVIADARSVAPALTKADVAEVLGVSLRQVSRWIASGQLEAARLGPRTTRVTQAQLDRFIARQSAGPPPPWPRRPRARRRMPLQ